jgi:two-component sensor histidine kinase
VENAFEKARNGKPYSIDHRIILANGEELTIHIQSEVIFDKKNIPIRLKGIVQDITERKKAEKAIVKLEIARKQEIHHRIKNNLQVISSLLDLQAEKFKNVEYIKNSIVMEAFRESQDRVRSMALIHEELHEGGEDDTLNFPPYLEKLVDNLFHTYRVGNGNIRLNMDLEENLFFNMDTAVPLGIIVNELVSNSLKHAFTEKQEGEIRIRLCRKEKDSELHKSIFCLTISDNGKGIPENIELENVESLGLQLVSTLVDQLDGEIELKRAQGTEFRITFNVAATGTPA